MIEHKARLKEIRAVPVKIALIPVFTTGTPGDHCVRHYPPVTLHAAEFSVHRVVYSLHRSYRPQPITSHRT